MARNAAELSLSSSSCSSLSSKDPTAHSSSWAASSDENRTVRIVYYLSRGGLLEQPHLLEVPLSTPQSGLTLRDVKKKLMSIRGKAMPAAFAWSYKRSYRNGYVWQDLCGDGDLIFPPSANQSEYIIKGCKLSHSTCYIRKSEEEEEEESDDDGDGDENDGELVDEDQELGQDHDQQRSSYSYGIRNGTSKHNKFHTKNSVDDEDYEEEDDDHHHHRLSSASKSKNSIIISPLNLSRNRRLSGANPAEVIMVKSSDAATQTEEELAALITNNNSNHFLRMNNMTSNESIMNQCTNPAADGIYHRLEPSINQCTNATNRTIINQCTNAANGTIINHRINPSINPCTNAATGTINHQRIDPSINQCTNATTGTINHQRIDPSINQCTNAGNGRINPRINPSIKATGSNHSNNHHDHCDHHDPMTHVTMPSPPPSSSPRRGPTVQKYENRNSNVISNEVDVISRKLGQINTTMPSSSNPNTALNCSNNSGGAPSSSSNHRMMIDQGASSSGSNEHRRIDQTYRPSSNYLSRYARPDHDRDEMIINGKAGGGLVLMNHNHNYKHNYDYNSPKSAINLPNNHNNNTKTAGNNCYLQERQDEKKFVSSGDGEYLVTLSPNSLDQKCNKLCNNSLGNLLHNWVSSCGGIINGLEDQVKNQEPMIRYDTRIIKHFNTNEDCNKPIGINDTVTVASKRFSFKSMKGLHNLISVLIKKDHYYNNNHNVVGDFKATVNDGRFEFCNRNQVVVNGDENCGTSSRRFSIGELIRAADDSPLRSSSGSLTDQYFFMRSCHDDDHRNNDIMNNIKRKS